jgi:lipopolysaccharide export LptBFGC system permease protein LptF
MKRSKKETWKESSEITIGEAIGCCLIMLLLPLAAIGTVIMVIMELLGC